MLIELSYCCDSLGNERATKRIERFGTVELFEFVSKIEIEIGNVTDFNDAYLTCDLDGDIVVLSCG